MSRPRRRCSPTPPTCRRLSLPGRCCGARDPLVLIQELSRAHVRRCRLTEVRGGCLSAGTSPTRAAPGICPRATSGSSRHGPAGPSRRPGGQAPAENRTAGRDHHALALGTWPLSGSRRTWTARSAIMTGPWAGPGTRRTARAFAPAARFPAGRGCPGRRAADGPYRCTPAVCSVTGWPKASGERAPAAVTGGAASTTKRSRWRKAL